MQCSNRRESPSRARLPFAHSLLLPLLCLVHDDTIGLAEPEEGRSKTHLAESQPVLTVVTRDKNLAEAERVRRCED